jgi:hypothetical protein
VRINVTYSTHGRNEKCMKPEGKRPLEDIGVDGSVIVEWIIKIWGGRGCTGCM